MKKVVIGVVGPMGSGKSLIIERMKKSGFVCYSLSDILRKDLSLLQIKQSREALQELGNFLRRFSNSGILAKITAKRLVADHHQRVVVDSIRHPGEIKVLRKRFKIKIIGIITPLRKRYQQLLLRNREGDPFGWNNFVKLSDKERSEDISYGQQVEKCMKYVDYKIVNDGTQDKLGEKIDKLIKKWIRK